MTVLFISHERCVDHDPGRSHPERPARLRAVSDAAGRGDLRDALRPVVARPATIAELTRVHEKGVVETIGALADAGGGRIDADTAMSAASFEAARLAAGAGLDAIERLDAGEGDSAFCAIRPPGHHATPSRAMGFCLFNNVAIAAATLADRGERVLIVDYDAHHGNGTQDAFYDDGRVFYISLHQSPMYPGTGPLAERGEGDGFGTTLNFPLPAGATGDVYRRAFDEVIIAQAEAFDPTWVLLSAGFDAHRRDPLTDLGLTSGDFAALTAEVLALAPPGRSIAFLEGGYDLAALADSTTACLGVLTGTGGAVESETSGGPGAFIVDEARALVTS